jgi:Rad3-related DNA helicase
MIDDIDFHFPIKKNDVPSYRKYQKETIEKILNGFYDKKFVAVEGPVGCGKSVINYTVGKCHGKKVTYLTSMKSLQDQINRERWVGVRSLKGKTGYLCNIELDKRITCGYDGDGYRTCENCDVSDLRPRDATMEKFINAMVDIWESDDDRSSFISENDFIQVMKTQLIPVKTEEYIAETSRPDEDRKAFYVGLPRYDNTTKELIEKLVVESMSCSLTYRECYHKSSRELAKIADTRVLNPDVFFNYNQSAYSPFHHSDLMVIDECHGFDGIMQRIFGSKIPITVIKTIYGIDLSEIYNTESGVESIKKLHELYDSYLIYIMRSLSFIKKLGKILTIHDNESYYNVKSKSIVFQYFQGCFNKIYGRTKRVDYNFLDILTGKVDDYDVNGALNEFMEIMYAKFNLTYSSKINLVIDNIKNFSDDKVGEYLIKLYDVLNPFLSRFLFLKGIKSSFVFEKTNEKRTTVLYDTPFAHEDNLANESEQALEIVVIDPGKIADIFFYSKADKVLFSSGTWIYPETQKKKLGISEVELIKIPSTFDIARRRIYVLDNMINFSLKEDGCYYYKLYPEVFVEQLESLVLKIKKLIRNKYTIDPNIIVHCHTNQLAELIAANLNNVDNYWIHLHGQVWNKKLNKYIDSLEKEVILSNIEKNHDSGITIVSPSLTEGVDFKYGKARAQIILKHPIPNIEAAYIKNKRKGNLELEISPDPDFVQHVIYTTLSQQYGRIMRSEDDWGFTFIFDNKFYQEARWMIKRPKLLEKMNVNFFFEGIMYEKGQFITPFKQ